VSWKKSTHFTPCVCLRNGQGRTGHRGTTLPHLEDSSSRGKGRLASLASAERGSCASLIPSLPLEGSLTSAEARHPLHPLCLPAREAWEPASLASAERGSCTGSAFCRGKGSKVRLPSTTPSGRCTGSAASLIPSLPLEGSLTSAEGGSLCTQGENPSVGERKGQRAVPLW